MTGLPMLTADDFGAFFREVHGYPPFPWQKRLLTQVAARGEWPDTLDLPTGSGKTAAIDIALFHLALQANLGPERRAPVRIAFVVDRRLVVDDAFERARKLETALVARVGDVTTRGPSASRCFPAMGHRSSRGACAAAFHARTIGRARPRNRRCCAPPSIRSARGFCFAAMAFPIP